jgi:hypothetical protein
VCRPPPPVVQERRERAAKARRNRWVSPERLSRHRIMREVSLFEHPHSGAHAGIRDGSDPRLLFQAKSLPIPAIHGKTRNPIASEALTTPSNAKPLRVTARRAPPTFPGFPTGLTTNCCKLVDPRSSTRGTKLADRSQVPGGTKARPADRRNIIGGNKAPDRA